MRRFSRARRVFFTLFLFITTLLAAQQNYSINEILKKTGASLHWDLSRQTGILTLEDKSLVFTARYPWMIVDGEKYIDGGPILYDNASGELLFSEKASQTIFSLFNAKEKIKTPYNVKLILIDPGHGGIDSGALAKYIVDGIPLHLLEKEVNFDIALRLEALLKKEYPDKKIILTRYDDTYMSLYQRVDIANAYPLDPYEGMLFISIHNNASLNKHGTGFEIWYLPPGYRRQILLPKDVPNKKALDILNLLWEEEFTRESKRLAELVSSEMNKKIGHLSFNRGIKQESWFVVTNKKMASILIEVGFITNAHDAEKLRDTEYLKQATSGVFNGICRFVKEFENR